MGGQFRDTLAGLTTIVVLMTGCTPSQPAYMSERRDLSTYLDMATDIEYPDSQEPRIDEVNYAEAPFTLSDPFETGNFWDLCLEDAVSMALQNSKVIRNLGSVNRSVDSRTLMPDALVGNSQSSATVYDPALVESDPFNGVEGALAEFDAQINSSFFWDRTDRAQNVSPVGASSLFNPFLKQDRATTRFEVGKKAATGSEFFLRSVTDYDKNNNPFRAVNDFYTTALEAEVRQPLLRGRGTQVNRIPVVIARINNDISLADFEANVRNMVMDVERSYWDLMCRYRVLDANKRARDRALETWRDIKAELGLADGGNTGNVSLQEGSGERTAEDELRARAQYYGFRAQVETSLRELYNAENHLRWLMGLASTDGRLIRPCDELTTSKIRFDWHEIHCEALVRTAELRRQKWVLRQREMELIAARNQLLPELNVTALYRWLGVGDDLTSTQRNRLDFPQPGSTAVESLTGGNYQEFRLGFEFAMPVGYRRELAGVRNVQLSMAREKARLEDMELNVSHLLTLAVRDMDGLLVIAQSHFNQLAATRSEVEALKEKIKLGETVNTDFVLRAYQRAVVAEIAYYQSICDYNKSIAQVHFRKGSLLEYNNICLAEGPWPKKAYFDALGHARRRSASRYIDYGWTRPHVISRGSVPQHEGTSGGFLVVPPDSLEAQPAAETIPTPGRQDVLPMPAASGVRARISGIIQPEFGGASRETQGDAPTDPEWINVKANNSAARIRALPKNSTGAERDVLNAINEAMFTSNDEQDSRRTETRTARPYRASVANPLR